MIKTVLDIDFEISNEHYEFNYQKSLTDKLDIIPTEFDQNKINEIVLWKVNRYVEVTPNILNLINSISISSDVIDEELTRNVLSTLIGVPGIQLAMASTILRYRNPKIYQIIDQRVYRILEGRKLKVEKNIDSQVSMYLDYLRKLRVESQRLNIPFDKADRVLYLLDKDKRMNKNIKLENYG